MIIHPDFISPETEQILVKEADRQLKKVHAKGRDGRNRIVRMGWDYEKPDKWLGDIQVWWVPLCGMSFKFYSEEFAEVAKEFDDADSVTVNEYINGQRIAPHIDSPAFGDVAILSLLADVIMRFVSPAGEVRDFEVPRRSLSVMSGELRTKWTHETLPLVADRRISVVYRHKL